MYEPGAVPASIPPLPLTLRRMGGRENEPSACQQ
jgi:hypothetical protein